MTATSGHAELEVDLLVAVQATDESSKTRSRQSRVRAAHCARRRLDLRGERGSRRGPGPDEYSASRWGSSQSRKSCDVTQRCDRSHRWSADARCQKTQPFRCGWPLGGPRPPNRSAVVVDAARQNALQRTAALAYLL